MGETTEFEKLRRKRKRKRNIKRFFGLVLAMILSIAGVIAADKIYHWDLGTKLSNVISGMRPGGGFPVPMDDLDVLKLLPMGKDIAVATSSGTYIYNSKGARLALWPNSYNQPVSKVGGGKLLTFDLGGTHLRVDNKSEEIYSEDVGGRIYAADIAQNGGMAVACATRGHLSKVTAYNTRYAVMYTWYTNTGTVYGLSMSPNGQRFAAVSLYSKGGKLTTQLHIHNTALSETEAEVAVVPMEDELVLSLQWTQQDTIQILTDRILYLFDQEGREIAREPAPTGLITCYNDPEGGMYLAYGDYREQDGVTVEAYDEKMKLAGSTQVNRKVLSIQTIDSGRVLLLTEGKLYLANDDLREVKERKAQDLTAVCGIGNVIYGITPDGLTRGSL
ncbi:MAG: DUF5711 family protein [Angelakisella sp.]|nr:DUF5711 family protein [Angelakisella sp.]